MKNKLLLITPKFPYPLSGACEQDRAAGIIHFAHLGFEVRVIAKVFDFQDPKAIAEFAASLGISVITVPYKSHHRGKIVTLKRYLSRFQNPFYWDGAAFDYADSEVKATLAAQLAEFRPDYVYFDYTYLWPLYKMVKQQGLPIITRSINFEPRHFLGEHGASLINYLRALPKYYSERQVVKNSALLFSISPQEKFIYEKMGARNVVNLPLRGLADILHYQHEVKESAPLQAFFMGSTYNVKHNAAALKYLLTAIIPQAQKNLPNKIKFHILGNKFPENFRKYLGADVTVAGYVEDLTEFLAGMDIAIMPSLFGAGMQQKIFEPLARGIPTITNARSLAGYPFKDGEHLLLAETPAEYVEALSRIEDIALREKLSRDSRLLSLQLFASNKLSGIILSSLGKIYPKGD